ncbi:SCO3242 family prenyltransferase [Nocardioides sp. SYSU D00065]|uniref:SCO3242 family prenyltransferase n=1 Tax=Nocardioides sp. SYSU D00065 TaxID=2817378 RepID=UPI001B33E52D|nr:UbiA family prenyltransferase [Nocardioides sp. SYSU D00065]
MRLGDLVELTRAPAAFSIPGDAWSGAAHAAADGRSWAMPLASTCLYWSGMAFNDWCDRHVDAEERPERPIPSGRVSPAAALGVAAGLGAAGVGLAAALGGRSAVAVAAPLALMVVTYDAAAKDAPIGPLAMASTRGLDVLLGAHSSPAGAWQPALAMTAHTAGLTWLSRGEVHGTRREVAATVTAGTLAVAAATAHAAHHDPDAGRLARLTGVGLSAAYALVVGRAQARAAQDPTADAARTATRTGIGGFSLLQGAWLARRGRLVAAATVVGAGPAYRALSRRWSPT